MKPITNILLVLALVCYVFLPFYDIKFQGGLNGFEFTAGLISRLGTLKGTLFALTPFLAGFLAVGLNCLKRKLWSGLSILPVLVVLYFHIVASDFHEFALIHTPDVTPVDELGEGFAIDGLGLGFVSSCTLYILSVISAVMALMPLKLNETIERAVDDTIDKGLEEGVKHIKQLGHEVRDEWSRIESRTKKHSKFKPTSQSPVDDGAAPQDHADGDVAATDNARYMPGNDEQPTTAPPLPLDKEDDSRFMPK